MGKVISFETGEVIGETKPNFEKPATPSLADRLRKFIPAQPGTQSERIAVPGQDNDMIKYAQALADQTGCGVTIASNEDAEQFRSLMAALGNVLRSIEELGHDVIARHCFEARNPNVVDSLFKQLDGVNHYAWYVLGNHHKDGA